MQGPILTSIHLFHYCLISIWLCCFAHNAHIPFISAFSAFSALFMTVLLHVLMKPSVTYLHTRDDYSVHILIHIMFN